MFGSEQPARAGRVSHPTGRNGLTGLLRASTFRSMTPSYTRETVLRGVASAFAALVLALLVGHSPTSAQGAPASAQVATLRVEENFRADPNGTVIGRLMPGTRVEVLEQRGSWVRASLQGFVWLPSLQLRQVGEFDLEVSESGGENLRDEAGGRVGARLLAGTRLEEIGRAPGWAEVRRTAWIWAESLDLAPLPSATTASTSPVGGAAVSPAALPATASSNAQGGGSTTVVPARAPEVVSGGFIRSGGGGSALLSAPGGDTLGRTREGAELRVTGRDGNWVRVQLDGWVWAPTTVLTDASGPVAGAASGGVAAASGAPAVVTTIQDVSRLTTEFAQLRGRLVEVRLQFISLERAEQVRTDFYEGEPFLLMRSLDGERSFVYVAIPPEPLASLGVLTPLETVRVVGRLRSGAAAFTGSPILDLVEIERTR